jgi:magnesium transporter
MTPLDLFKVRIPWLMILMISATFTGIIITKFEDALQAMLCLNAFIPMLMDTGGNAGSQASVSIIRSLALKEVKFSDYFTVIWREIRTSVICGAVMAALTFSKVMLVDRLILGNEQVTAMVALAVSLTIAVTILCAKIVGATLPMVADRLGFDPAVMASPLITTIVDALSLLIYFGVAKLLLGI